MSGTIRRAKELCFTAFYRKRSRDLKFVNNGTCFFDRIERFNRTQVWRHICGVRLGCGFILIVDDEDSRNASIVGVEAERPGAVVRGMSVPTPGQAGLLEGYDRRQE